MRSILFSLLATLALAGCQTVPAQQPHYSFFPGGGLSAEDYAVIEPYVVSQTVSIRSHFVIGQVVAPWAYAFVPGTNPRSITHVTVGEFTGKTPETVALAKALVPALRARLDDAGVPAEPESPATRVTISGVVTDAGTVKDGDGDVQHRTVKVEARISQADRTLGAIQINVSMPRHRGQIIPGPAPILLGTLIARALEPDIAEDKVVAGRAALYLANPFYQIRRSGAAQGTSPGNQAILRPVSSLQAIPRLTDTP